MGWMCACSLYSTWVAIYSNKCRSVLQYWLSADFSWGKSEFCVQLGAATEGPTIIAIYNESEPLRAHRGVLFDRSGKSFSFNHWGKTWKEPTQGPEGGSVRPLRVQCEEEPWTAAHDPNPGPLPDRFRHMLVRWNVNNNSERLHMTPTVINSPYVPQGTDSAKFITPTLGPYPKYHLGRRRLMVIILYSLAPPPHQNQNSMFLCEALFRHKQWLYVYVWTVLVKLCIGQRI